MGEAGAWRPLSERSVATLAQALNDSAFPTLLLDDRSRLSLLGQVREEVAQVDTGMAEPFSLGGEAEYGLHRGEGDQFGITQAGRNPAGWRHGASSGYSCNMSSVAA